MITSSWGALWAIVILVIAMAQIGYKAVIADPKSEEGILAFLVIAAIVAVQLLAWLFQWSWLS